MFQPVVEDTKTHVLCSVTLPPLHSSKIVPFVRECGENIVERVRPHDNMAYAHCILDTPGYKYTLRLRNTHCFCAATTVARTVLIVTLYVHCLSCLISCNLPNFVRNSAVIFRSIDPTKVAFFSSRIR
jgi:hypothetical protein